LSFRSILHSILQYQMFLIDVSNPWKCFFSHQNNGSTHPPTYYFLRFSQNYNNLSI
jgi:hypothetical protein